MASSGHIGVAQPCLPGNMQLQPLPLAAGAVRIIFSTSAVTGSALASGDGVLSMAGGNGGSNRGRVSQR